MRLFTAIDLPEDILRRMERLLNSLRPEALIRWSPLDNLHITTKFIGEWPPQRLAELEAALSATPPARHFLSKSAISAGSQMSARRKCSGAVFTPARNSKFWLATQSRLWRPSAWPLRIVPDSPHLTLARLKNPVPLEPLRARVDELQPALVGSFEVTDFCLYRSDPGSQSSVYRKLETFRLQNALAAS